MRILLDECIPRGFKRSLHGLDCLTVAEAGFAGKKNGILLAAAELAGFQVFVTMDKGVQYQQNLQGRTLVMLVIRAKSNRLDDIAPFAQQCVESLHSATAGQIIRVG